MTANKTGKKPQVYLIHGEDELLVSSTAKEIIRKAIPAEEEMLGLETINARADKVEDALIFVKRCREAVQTIGFMGGRKAVWLRNANFLDQGIIGKSKEVRARLQDLAGAFENGLPAGHILVITSPNVDLKSELYQASKNEGKVIGFKDEKAWQRDKSAVPFVAGALQKLGITAAHDVLQALVAKAGTDSRLLQQEAEKLALYLGTGQTARRADVDTIVSPARELFGWDLDDAVGKRDLPGSLRILRQLLFQKVEPIRLMVGLESRFRSLLVLREALDKGWIRASERFLTKGKITPDEEQLMYQALNDNRLKNPYVAALRTNQANGFTRKELERCQRLILKTRRQLVSSSFPAPLAMEMLIVKLCRKPARKI